MDEQLEKVLGHQIKDLNNLKKELLKKEKSLEEIIKKKNTEELKVTEQELNCQLEKLQRENFLLQISIGSWQRALAKKLNECQEAESELNELYNKIWSERENFCDKADEFNSKFGVLSEKWKKQIEYVKNFKGQQNKEVLIDNSFNDVAADHDSPRKDIPFLEEKECFNKLKLFVGSRNNFNSFREEKLTEIKISTEDGLNDSQYDIEIYVSPDEDDATEVSSEVNDSPQNDLFSMMDIDDFKEAKRKQSLLKKSVSSELKKNLM